MDIKHPRRILILGPREAGALDIVKDLTGSAPTPDVDGSTAGLTHEWNVKNVYYTAKVPIWVDELSDVAIWKTEFLRPEAKEVTDAVGAWIYCFERRKDGGIDDEVERAMESIQEVVEKHAVYGADCVMLAVARPAGKQESGRLPSKDDQEDICMQYGFEYIDYAATGNNEFGEKVGIERLKEALEANEWNAAGDEDDLGLDLEDLDPDGDASLEGLGLDEAEMTAELFGMKAALHGDDFDPEAEDISPHEQQATQVDDLDRIMGRLLAVREQSTDLPEAQRRRLAAKAVRDLLRADDTA